MSKVACFMKFTFPTSVKFQRTSSRRLPLVAQAFLVGFGSLFASKSSKTRCDQQKEPPGLQVELKDWLLKNGGHFAANITVEQIPGRGYGIVNRGGTIKQGKILLRVPWELILCKEQVEKDPALQSILHQWASTEPEKYTSQAIRLWLLHGAGHTDWSPWLSKLPHDIGAGAESLPLALAFCHSDALRGTSLQHAAELQLESLRSEWGRLKQFLDVSLERFIWAQAMLSTRSSTLPMDGKVLSCLIPVVDFVNHDFHPNAFIQGRKQGVELISCEGIPPGGEVLISYGQHDPLQFFFAFGFLPDVDIAQMLVPLRANKPLLLRANQQDLEELLTAMATDPGQSRLQLCRGFFDSGIMKCS